MTPFCLVFLHSVLFLFLPASFLFHLSIYYLPFHFPLSLLLFSLSSPLSSSSPFPPPPLPCFSSSHLLQASFLYMQASFLLMERRHSSSALPVVAGSKLNPSSLSFSSPPVAGVAGRHVAREGDVASDEDIIIMMR